MCRAMLSTTPALSNPRLTTSTAATVTTGSRSSTDQNRRGREDHFCQIQISRIATATREGRRRLRLAAKTCLELICNGSRRSTRWAPPPRLPTMPATRSALWKTPSATSPTRRVLRDSLPDEGRIGVEVAAQPPGHEPRLQMHEQSDGGPFAEERMGDRLLLTLLPGDEHGFSR